MNKYNIEELREKLNRYKNIPLSEINPDDVADISSIKIDRRKSSNEIIFDF